MHEKKPEFIVTDRRKFTSEGELRGEEPSASEASHPPEPEPSVQELEKHQDEPAVKTPEPAQEAPAEDAEHGADAGTKPDSNEDFLDDLARSNGETDLGPMNFERMVQSIYMTAAIQMGAGTPANEQPRVDIVGARQSIDMLGILEAKTKGNLTRKEQQLLQHALYELRMSFLEITNAIAQSAHNKPPNPNQPR